MRIRRTIALAAAAATPLLLPAVPAHASTTVFSKNLLYNHSADAAPGSTDGSEVPLPYWTRSGTQASRATAVQYGSPGFPSATDPGPDNRGPNLFAGGAGCSVNQSINYISQQRSLTPYLADIQAGRASFVLKGWLGGKGKQPDSAIVSVDFDDASGSTRTSAAIGPVTRSDRHDITELLFERVTGQINQFARTVTVTVEFRCGAAPYNDGYADRLDLQITTPAAG
jgi:hypothetical protein